MNLFRTQRHSISKHDVSHSRQFRHKLARRCGALRERSSFDGFETLEDRMMLSELIVGANVNISQLAGNQDESAIAINPNNSDELFAFSNNDSGGLFAARSTNGGATWQTSNGFDDLIADGNDSLVAACCDPTATWDVNDNLFIAYLNSDASAVAVAISTNGGNTFTPLATLGAVTDQPTIVTGPGEGGVDGSVWLTWNENGEIVVSGATVTGTGVLNVGAFSAPVAVPGMTGFSFGDIAIGSNGQVVVTAQNNDGDEGPDEIRVNTDPDGLGAAPFGTEVIATTTNVGDFDAIPAQNLRTVDAESGLAYDRSGGTYDGRLYLVYTDEVIDESNNLDIMVRYSDDDGATWSVPVKVNDDATTRSQFMPKIALDQVTGNVGVVWYDARNGFFANRVQLFGSVSLDGGVTWLPNTQISTGTTRPTVFATGGQQLGDYLGLVFSDNTLHPTWADNSNNTGDNPDGTNAELDIYTAAITVGPKVITLSPPDNSINVPLTTDLGITFDENIAKGSGNIRIRLLSTSVIVQTISVASAAVTVAGAVATINPPTDLVESTDYYIEVDAGAFENINGGGFRGITGTTTWNFKTVGVPPVVVSLSPPDNSIQVPLDTNLVMTFDEPIAKGTGNIVIRLVSDNSIVQTVDVTSAAVTVAGATATINPPADLADSTAFYVQVAAGAFKDLKDNNFAGIVSSTTWNFTTTPCIGPDAYGYQGCAVPYAFTDISTSGTAIVFSNLDDGTAELTDAALGDFQFQFYGTTYSNLFVSTNGLLSFGSSFAENDNTDLTSEAQAIIAPLWDDLVDSGVGKAYWQVQGTGKREFLIVQWNQWDYLGSSTGDITFQVILSKWDHSIRFNYSDLTDGLSSGSDGAEATIGIKDAAAQTPATNQLLISQNSGPNAFVGSGVSVLIKDTNVAAFDGTLGDDIFVFDASGLDYLVEVNGLPFILDASVVDEIKFDGLAGNDTILVTGNALADTATLEPGMLVMENSVYLLTACTVETIRVSGESGNDLAYLYDSAGNDKFYGRPAYSYMTSPDFYNRVEGFEKVYAYATAGDAGGDGDQAFLYDSIGNDTFRGEPMVSSMTGTGYYNQAEGFDKVLAFATEGDAGGVGDRAFLHDSTGGDTFIGRPTHSTLKGTDFVLKAKSFDKVFAYADAFDISGIVDRAFLYDSAGNDKFVSDPTHSFLSGVTFFNSVEGFDKVIAHASGNAGGVRDRAYLYDSAGSDKFIGRPTFSYMTGSDFFNKANGFNKVFAYASEGDGDRAFLHGSVGNDRFVGQPDYSYLTGIGFYNQAKDFDKVYAYASRDAGGLRDRAFLYDSAGNDQFYGRSTYSYLTGVGFFNQASGFDNVFAFATAGGVGDQAYFYDSRLNDTFFGRGMNAQLTGFGFLIFAKGFDSVDAYAYNGGFDTIDNRGLKYVFFRHGAWEKIL